MLSTRLKAGTLSYFSLFSPQCPAKYLTYRINLIRSIFKLYFLYITIKLFQQHLFFFNILFIFEREKQECEGGRVRERGRHRIQSRLQALNCQHRAWCRAQTYELWGHDLRSWSWKFNQQSHPGAPFNSIY